MNPYVTKIDESEGQALKALLEQQGFELGKPPYTQFQGKKKGLSVTLYTSGKLVVQGKEMEEFILYQLEPNVLKTVGYNYDDQTARIGVDESGKGDFFGPLCVAAFFASGEGVSQLRTLGVKDCKSLSDSKIETLAAKLQKYPHEVVVLRPEKYNELYAKFRNLNQLLAWGHATVIHALSDKTGCQNVILDQFADESVVLTALKKKGLSLDVLQKHRAEEDLVVAAASILARAAFLKELKRLSEWCGVTLPKGASQETLKAGQIFLNKWGKEKFIYVAKCHFKTLAKINGESES
ncbi:MAG: ribonuclease HIII [Chlamydiia bacterium]|nr:ribonuclease HIII [Chlamydiia bacterium]